MLLLSQETGIGQFELARLPPLDAFILAEIKRNPDHVIAALMMDGPLRAEASRRYLLPEVSVYFGVRFYRISLHSD